MRAGIDQLSEIDEAARRAFEADWVRGTPRPIAEYLPEDDSPQRLATLEELVCIDLEFSWKRRVSFGTTTESPKVEDYSASFPELSHVDTLKRLCLQEFEVRHQCGDRPTADEFFRRFPVLVEREEELRGAMERIAAAARSGPPMIDATLDVPASSELPNLDDSKLSAVATSGRDNGFDTLNGFLDDKRSGQTSPLATETKLAEGGMGAVLVCRDQALQRRVAVKVMKPEITGSEEHRARFLEEAQITGQLEHPNIVPIHDLGKDAGGNLYFSMKLVKGQSLGQILAELKQSPKGKGRSLTELLDIFMKVADGLAFAHSKGVVHRDLKPDNIMIGDFGEVLIMDWGLAKLLGRKSQEETADSSRTLAQALETKNNNEGGTIQSVRATSGVAETQDGTVQGTPAYMPPEQAFGHIDQIDARSDIYSLGAILYEILTLERPVTGKTVIEVLLNVCEGKVIPPDRRTPHRWIPKELSAVVMKAMQTEREDRYQTVQQLASDIRLFLEGRAVSAREDSLLESLIKLVRRNKAVSTAIAVAATIILVLATVSYVRITKERDRAVENEKLAKENEDRAVKNESRAVAGEKAAKESEQKAVTAQQRQHETSLAASKRFALQAVEQANLNKLEPAKRRAADAALVAPDSPWADFANGAIAMARVDYPQAVELFRKAAANPDGDQPEIQAALAEALAQQGKLNDAEALLANLDTIDDWRIVMSVGRALYAAHKWDACQKPLSRALALMNMEKDRPQDNVIEVERLLAAAPAQKACEGFYEEVRHLPVGELRQRLSAKLGEIHGNQSNFKFTGDLEQGVIGAKYAGFTHLYPLRGLPIRVATIYGPVWDLSPLEGMPLETLNLGNCGNVTDLSPLAQCPTLRELDNSRIGVTDLTPLHGLKLRSLDCFLTKIDDLAPLSGMPLEYLNISGTNVSDLTPLNGMPLNTIYINQDVSDLTPLEGMPLTSITIDNKAVRSLEPLRGMKLESFTWGYFDSACDLSPLAGMPLKHVALSNSGVSDLSPLRGAPLEYLNLQACHQVRDLSPLRGAPLAGLYLFDCWIKDVSPLATFKKIDTKKCPWVPYLLGRTTDEQFEKQLRPIFGDNAPNQVELFKAQKMYGTGHLKEAIQILDDVHVRPGINARTKDNTAWISAWLKKELAEQQQGSDKSKSD